MQSVERHYFIHIISECKGDEESCVTIKVTFNFL
jgi:hypothetical protein